MENIFKTDEEFLEFMKEYCSLPTIEAQREFALNDLYKTLTAAVEYSKKKGASAKQTYDQLLGICRGSTISSVRQIKDAGLYNEIEQREAEIMARKGKRFLRKEISRVYGASFKKKPRGNE